MVEYVLDDVLRKTVHSAQCGNQSVLYNDVEQIMLHLSRQHVIEETVNAYIAKYFNIYADAEGLSKMFST